jgi:hypothetical protein
MPVKHAVISLDYVHCHKNGELSGAEPYLLTAFFKVDGDTVVVESGALKGPCTFVGTVGSHGDLDDTDVHDGDDVPIPSALGEIEFTLTPIPEPLDDAYAGVIVALLEEDWGSHEAAQAGRAAFNRAAEGGLNEALPKLRPGPMPVTPEIKAALLAQLAAAVKKAFIDVQGHGVGWLELLVNPDKLIGGDGFVSNKTEPIRARFQRVAVSPSPNPTTPGTTYISHDYELFGKLLVFEEPPRHRHLPRSLPLKTPAPAGAPTALEFLAAGVTSAVYRDAGGRLHELRRTGTVPGTRNLTELADNAIRADADPTSYVDTAQGHEVVLYRGSNGHVHSIYWAGETFRRDELGGSAAAPKVIRGGKPAGFVQQDGTNVAVYRTEAGDLQSLAWKGTNAPTTERISGFDGAPPAAGDPAPFVNTREGVNIVVYRGSDLHLHSIHWRGIEAVRHDALSSVAGAPRAAGDPVAYYAAAEDAHVVVYRGENGHLLELSWKGIEPVRRFDLNLAVPSAPLPAGDPAICYGAGTRERHVVYRSADGHLNDIFGPSGGSLKHVDLTGEAIAPPAAPERPAAFIVESPYAQHVFYRGTDGQIHEIRSLQENSGPPPPPPPPPVTVPDVIDLAVNLAGRILRDAGLVPRFTGGGTWVRSQSPGGGASVPRGSTVTCPTRRGPQL